MDIGKILNTILYRHITNILDGYWLVIEQLLDRYYRIVSFIVATYPTLYK